MAHPGYEDDKDDASRHGLRLILEDLNSTWTAKKIRELSGELGTFILPPELKGQGDIDIVINAEQHGISGEHVRGTHNADGAAKDERKL